MQEEKTRLLIDLQLVAKNLKPDGSGEAGMRAIINASGDLNHVVRMLAAVLHQEKELQRLLLAALSVNDQETLKISDEEFKRAFE